MNGQQRTVLWIGLILVGLNLAMHWSEIASVIFSGAGITGGVPSGGSSGSNDNPSVQVPIDPLLPTGPKITVPLPKLKLM